MYVGAGVSEVIAYGVEGITNMKDLYLLLACYGSIDRSYFKIASGNTKLMF